MIRILREGFSSSLPPPPPQEPTPFNILAFIQQPPTTQSYVIDVYFLHQLGKEKDILHGVFRQYLCFWFPGQHLPHPLVLFLFSLPHHCQPVFVGFVFFLGFCILEYHTFGFLSSISVFLAFSLPSTAALFSHFPPLHSLSFFFEVVLDISILAKFLPIANQYIKCKISISISIQRTRSPREWRIKNVERQNRICKPVCDVD